MYPLLVPCVPSGPANISMVWVEAEPLHFLFHHFGVLNDLWSFNSKKRAVPLRGTARFLLCFVVLFVFLEPTAPKLVGEDIWNNYFQNWKEDYIIIFSGAAKRASLLGCRTTSVLRDRGTRDSDGQDGYYLYTSFLKFSTAIISNFLISQHFKIWGASIMKKLEKSKDWFVGQDTPSLLKIFD